MIERFDSFINATIAANIELYRDILPQRSSIFYKEKGGVGAGGDMSIGMDIEAEKVFIKHLGKFGRIDSEESGLIGNGEYTIMIDPLDGSDNFKSNIPYFGSSVAIEKDDRVKVGIITNLADGTLFLKTDELFQYTKLDSLKFYDLLPNPYASVGVFERAYRSRRYSKKLSNSGYKYRSLGAVALSLAYTNNLQFFIYEGEMRAYDVRAGLFMCEGFYQHKEKDLTIICQDIKHFEKLKKILL